MSWNHDGDLAKVVARQLQEEQLALVVANGEALVDEEPVMTALAPKSVFSKIVFRWRADEKDQLDRIRAAADAVIGSLFDDAKFAIDEFYAEMRVPEHHPDTGMVLKDKDGRPVWQLDHRGKPIERWDQMTGQDIEKCLLDLERVRVEIAPRVNELLMEAVFAKNIHEDRREDAYDELVEETIPGRNAYAARKTRQDKYHAYFCYYLWSQAKVFQAEVEHFCYVLERIRQWRISDGKTTP